MRASKAVEEIQELIEKHEDIELIGYTRAIPNKDLIIESIELNLDSSEPVILIEFSPK